MCASSAISDYYMRRDHRDWQNPGPPAMWPQTFPQVVQSDPELKQLLREVVQRLDKIDKKLGDRDCKDETKAAFYKALDLDPPSEGTGI